MYLITQRDAKKYSLLSKLIANMLLILQSLVQSKATSSACIGHVRYCSFDLTLAFVHAGTYHTLRGALSSLGPSSSTTDAFRHLLTKYPLLTLHYASLNFYLNGDITVRAVFTCRSARISLTGTSMHRLSHKVPCSALILRILNFVDTHTVAVYNVFVE